MIPPVNKDPSAVSAMFGRIAESYDFTNGILSFQMHRVWNQALANSIPSSTYALLDICSGTGEILYRWLKKQHSPKQAFALDFCPQMLQIAQDKSAPYKQRGHSLSFIEADASKIPLETASIDAVSVAYGVRNIQNLPECLKEVHRVLKKEGSFCILELTEPSNPLLKGLHTLYLKKILPWLGKLTAKDEEAYRYLAASIPTFIKPEKLTRDLAQHGFSLKKVTPLMGGIATLIQVKKP